MVNGKLKIETILNEDEIIIYKAEKDLIKFSISLICGIPLFIFLLKGLLALISTVEFLGITPVIVSCLGLCILFIGMFILVRDFTTNDLFLTNNKIIFNNFGKIVLINFDEIISINYNFFKGFYIIVKGKERPYEARFIKANKFKQEYEKLGY